jgi:hypothetical protein
VETSLEILFISISIENIIQLWEALLLERKVFLISQSKSLLTHICMALVSLLFPFKWIHVLIPILPEKLRVFTESPVPLLIGIHFKLDLNEVSSESMVFNIESNVFEKYTETMPKLPQKLYTNLTKQLEKYKKKFKNEEDESKVSYCDEVFNYCGDLEDTTKIFNTEEIRDFFYEFFINIFKNYEKYFGFKNRKVVDGKLQPLAFNREYFLKDHSSYEESSFLFKFTETNMFGNFEEGFQQFETNYTLQFFIDSIKKEKKKGTYYMPAIVPNEVTHVPEINSKNIEQKTYYYKVFPKLNPDLYTKFDMPKPQYRSKFEISKDEWCYDTAKLPTKEWCKYMIYCIHELWFQFFSVLIPTFDDKRAASLIDHAIYILEDLIKKKITPTRELYSKLIRACGRTALNCKVNLIFSTMPQANRQNNPMFYNAFLNGLYDVDQFQSENPGFHHSGSGSQDQKHGTALLRSKNSISYNRSTSICNLDNLVNSATIEGLIDACIFLGYDYCPNCYKNKKIKKIGIEEMLGGFRRDKCSFFSVCNICLSKIYPKLYILFDTQMSVEITDTVNLLSPTVLLKETENLIKNNGERYFLLTDYYQQKEHRQIFWNIVFYFQLLNLPTSVLYIQKNEVKLSNMIERLELMRHSSSKKLHNSMNSTHRLNSLNSEMNQVRRSSTASNDFGSVFSGPNIKTNMNINNYEKILNSKVNEKVEHIMNIEIDKSLDDKSEIMTNVYEIRQIIQKNVEEFNAYQKFKLEGLYKNLEYNEELEKSLISPNVKII